MDGCAGSLVTAMVLAGSCGVIEGSDGCIVGAVVAIPDGLAGTEAARA